MRRVVGLPTGTMVSYGSMLELGTVSYTEVVPTPIGGRVWRLVKREGERWRPAKTHAGPADRD
jgi:hypothetical protein